MLTELVKKLLVDESAVSSSAFVVHDLLPETQYTFYAISLTVAGPSYENSSVVDAETTSAGLNAGHYVAISIAVFFVLVFVVIGGFTCIRYCSLGSLYLSFL